MDQLIQDLRTIEELQAVEAALPRVVRQKVRERKRRRVKEHDKYFYQLPLEEGGYLLVDPENGSSVLVRDPARPGETEAGPQQLAVDICQEVGEDLSLSGPDSYIPREVLDGPNGRGGLRKDAQSTVPDAEQKYWQRKYALAYAMNGRNHFEVNDAWRRGTPHDGLFDLRRACRLRVDDLAAGADDGEVGDEPLGRLGEPVPVAGEDGGGDLREVVRAGRKAAGRMGGRTKRVPLPDQGARGEDAGA